MPPCLPKPSHLTFTSDGSYPNPSADGPTDPLDHHQPSLCHVLAPSRFPKLITSVKGVDAMNCQHQHDSMKLHPSTTDVFTSSIRVSRLSLNNTNVSSKPTSTATLTFDGIDLPYSFQCNGTLVSRSSVFGISTALSITTLLQHYIISWLSFNPGICTYGMNLACRFTTRLNLTVIEPNALCRSLNAALLPNATVVEGYWAALTTIFETPSSVDTVTAQCRPIPTLRPFVPLISSISKLNGIDFLLRRGDSITIDISNTNVNEAACVRDSQSGASFHPVLHRILAYIICPFRDRSSRYRLR